MEDFDYFFLGGEDLFVIPDNLRAYLSTLGSPDEAHFAGRRFKGRGEDNYFNSGGAGYALSRGTLRKYIAEGYEDEEHCSPHRRTPMEDVMMARCLRHKFGLGLTDTRDGEGRERFHPFAPGTHFTWKHDPKDWYEEYNQEWGIKLGAQCCAPDSVSFHYIKKPAMVRHLHCLLYDCQKS
uniref:Hexosyltransferase n=1 Tax=Grammatophora oceanica TaxID=210454 RepID=A0A7S1Y610_9STRA